MARASKKEEPKSEWADEGEKSEPQQQPEQPASDKPAEMPARETPAEGGDSSEKGRRDFPRREGYGRRDDFDRRGGYERRGDDFDRRRDFDRRGGEFDRRGGDYGRRDYDRDFDRRGGDFDRRPEGDRFGPREGRRYYDGGYRGGDRFGPRDDYREDYGRRRPRQQLREDPVEPNETIGMFSLSYNLTPSDFDEYLKEKLAEFKGRFTTKLVLSTFTDRCRGYGFVHFDSIEDAIKAKALLENGEILGQPYRVAYSIQRRRMSDSSNTTQDRGTPIERVQEEN